MCWIINQIHEDRKQKLREKPEKLPEGTASKMRKEFTPTIKREIILRSQGHCEDCGIAIKKGTGEVDHTLADGLTIDKKTLTADDGKHLCKPCHAKKTGDDIKKISKANRQFKKDQGITKKKPWPKPPKQSKRQKPRIEKQELPRRSLYRSE